MNKIDFKGIILDLDGLLIDSESIALKAWYEGGKKVGLNISQKVLIKTAGHPIEQRIKIIEKAIGTLHNKNDYLNQTTKIYFSLLFSCKNLLKKGVQELLTYLKENNYLIGLATSSKTDITETILKSNNIISYFDIITTSDNIIYNKPNPEIYLKCLERLRLKKDETIAVEDSENGSLSSLSAGIRTILIPDITEISEGLISKFEYIFPSLLDFLYFLKK